MNKRVEITNWLKELGIRSFIDDTASFLWIGVNRADMKSVIGSKIDAVNYTEILLALNQEFKNESLVWNGKNSEYLFLSSIY
jgi:hypothetical protein